MYRLDVLKISFDSGKVFTLLILPINVSVLHFQTFKTFSMLRILSSKFNLSALRESYEKKTPSTQIGSSGQLKLKGVSCPSFQQPNHIALVFDILTCKPEVDANFSSKSSKCPIELRSLTKLVVSSAYIVVFISFSLILIPLIRSSHLIALTKSSRPITKSKPDNGQPCLTHQFIGKKCEACPLFKMQLEISV